MSARTARRPQVLRTAIGLVLTTSLVAFTVAADAPPVPRPASPAPSGAASSAQDDAQDFVVFGASRPVLLRLHIRVNDRSFRDVFKDFVDEVFKGLDKNGDGVLNKAEVEKLPNARMIFTSNAYLFGFPPLRIEEVDLDKDGKVTRQELATYFEVSGASAFKLVEPGNSGEKLSEALFKHVDTDKDGKLSKEELRAAPATLLALDKDEDEMVTAQELDDKTPNIYAGGPPLREGDVPKSPRVRPTVMTVKPGDSMRRLAGELLNFYAPGAEPKTNAKLTRAEIGLDEPTFRVLDTNNDGKLDAHELSRFAARVPDLEMIVRLEAKPGAGALSVVKREPSPLAGQYVLDEGKTLAAELGTTRFTLNAVNEAAPRAPGPDYRQNYTFQFKRADKDNNGYLDKNEAQSSVFAALFDLLDADGDGKLYEKEIFDFAAKVQSLNDRALSSMTSLAVTAEGQGLFDLVDKNKDGRLSVREMRGFVQLLETLDRNHDGFLDSNEIPRKYALRVQRGPGNVNAPVPAMVVVRGGMATALPAASLDGPVWFRKMDRNRDGDVSRREFLGSDEQFRKIDRDGDGLISLEEAKRAEAERWKEKKQP
jgi:Ca2+-binding EF-hand superfamily protein